MTKKLLIALIFFACTLSILSCSKKEIEDKNVNESSNQLLFMNSDLKLTQEQVMSRIKAEYLKENNGYKDNDEVISIVSLPNKSLIDVYNDSYFDKYQNVSDFILSNTGRELLKVIEQEQEALIKELKEANLITSVEYNYSVITNAVAVKTTYKNFLEVSKLKNVSNVNLCDTYNLPTSSTDTSAILNNVDVYETGIFNSSSVSYTGKNTAVAVLDSGFDCSHSVFNTQPESPLISMQTVDRVLMNTRAKAFTRNLEVSDVYYSRKIPFAYDYADKDADVFPYDSEHGTHVAGIIGGQDDVITGIAVNTQLVLLKVFPDLDEGASTDDILAALEDAVILGVDCINMSLGSSCGFVREEDGNIINDVYDKIDASGISLIAAASNSYSSGFGGEQGNTNMVTNPDSSTVGSPSTYKGALSVASISGTKSSYLVANNEQVFFFKESNDITGKPNDFVKELGITSGMTKTYEYVTIPGVGLKVNFTSVGDLTGKIALIKRGGNTFEEKAQNAMNAGAVACIIYNNVDGDILMSMGKSEHIPTISISKDDGTILASVDKGTITVSANYMAGPFMSDFSSWGPTPNLEIKPEITAHGGNIKSSVPGGEYDELSGTSMASPNLCGIVVLIRQYLKEKYPTASWKEISVLTNQLLMSTATIVLNEEGNPYSPRKQGAGLASLFNAVNTNGYITIDGIDRTKLELKDDSARTGSYTMTFNVVNLGDKPLQYKIDLDAMTESVSTSDEKHVAEKAHMLSNHFTLNCNTDKVLNENTLTVPAHNQVSVTLKYQLTEEEMKYIDSSFPYGMYVEGFVKLLSLSEDIDLSIPFLAFYGDWSEAPMFDKTYYEVEKEAHDNAIDDEDKLKADYYATTPYGSYFYNYIIPLGTYLYDVDTSMYDAIPASLDHIALSNVLGTIDGISTIYAGLLRNAKTMEFTIKDKLTGEVVFETTDYNARKAYSNGAQIIPYFNFLKLKSADYNFINNREYTFEMKGLLDFENNGETTNVRNKFSFDFTMDDEAPILKEVSYEKVYDKTLKKDRYYITMTVYDNQYVQSITPIIFTSSSTYTFLSDNPIPVYSEKGKDNKVRFEITEYLDEIYSDEIITSALAFSIDDYALNSNLYICELPGTKGDFKFTKDGEMDGSDLLILSCYEDEILDLTKYLATSDKTVDDEKDYLKYLQWSSSNNQIAEVQEGILKANKAGKVTVTVREQMNGKQAILIINVKEKQVEKKQKALQSITTSIKSLRFSYFETLFAYSRAAQTSEIGQTGSRIYLSSLDGISFYPGEKIQLFYDLDPWYVADKYNLTYSSSNPSVATVDESGVVTGLKKGTTNIILSVEGSNILARVKITIKSEFVIENRTLIAYKGLGGKVVIPDDEGILYIGAYAFCLYNTDTSIELPEDDYDANKIPSTNTSVTSVVIPHGVEEIQKYAFYNCINLRSVEIPSTIKFIREYAFYHDAELTSINTEMVQVIGKECFAGCTSLTNIATDKMYTMGVRAFDGCTQLSSIDLTKLRNTGAECFRDCTSLKEVIFTKDTKLSYGMFARSGITSVNLYEHNEIPAFCFAKCTDLETVILNESLVKIGNGAFSDCTKLKEVNILGACSEIDTQAFYNCSSLTKFMLPDSSVSLGAYAFLDCISLKEIIIQDKTVIENITGAIFDNTAVEQFNISNNSVYATLDGTDLYTKDYSTLLFVSTAPTFDTYVIKNQVKKIGNSAFAGVKVKEVQILHDNVEIGDYAFRDNKTIEKLTILGKNITIGAYAFCDCTNLEEVDLTNVTKIGKYAFSSCTFTNVLIPSNVLVEEGAFFKSKLEKVTIGANSTFGLGAFQYCSYLKEVIAEEDANIHFGRGAFAYCTNLQTFNFSALDETIESETFYGCKMLKSATLKHVKTIGDYAFADCSALAYISVPVVEEIGEGAIARYDTYGGAPTITNMELPNTLRKLSDGAFLGCEGLLEITIPSSVETYGDYIFAYCLNLQKVTLPNNLKTIGEYAFAGCSMLSSINLENVEEIRNYAFIQTESLETVDLSSTVTIGDAAFAQSYLNCALYAPNLESIGAYAFQNAHLTKVDAKNLKTIKEASFQGNKNLTSFTFTNKIESIGEIAFYQCTKLAEFNYLDGEVVKTSGKINDYVFVQDGILYSYLSINKYSLKAVPSAKQIDTLEVLENTILVELYAGSANENIKTIILPDSMKVIENYAFYGYKNLKVVEFKSVSAPILESYYFKDTSLNEEDPGYAIIHKYLDLFNLYLQYYTFIDLVGKKEPITMVLPANQDIKGYDGLVYEVYFGKVEDAERSNYIAMEKSMVDFLNYSEKLAEVTVITLNDEALITNTLTAYNAIKGNYKDYNIDDTLWNNYVTKVKEDKETLRKIKLAVSDKVVKEMQKELDTLVPTFTIDNMTYVKDLVNRMNNFDADNKQLLDLTNYNKLLESYNQYCQSVLTHATAATETANATFTYIAHELSILSLAIVFFYLIKKREM